MAVDLAAAYAGLVRQEFGPRELWFRQWGPVAQLWLVTETIDRETERRLTRIGRQLYSGFPETLIDFHLLNPRLLEEDDLRAFIPDGAKSLPLQ